jgi:hypothetical protein
MIIPMILWVLLAVAGCAAFAVLGIWASISDEGHQAQRRRAIEGQVIPALRAAESEMPRAAESEILLATRGRP